MNIPTHSSPAWTVTPRKRQISAITLALIGLAALVAAVFQAAAGLEFAQWSLNNLTGRRVLVGALLIGTGALFLILSRIDSFGRSSRDPLLARFFNAPTKALVFMLAAGPLALGLMLIPAVWNSLAAIVLDFLRPTIVWALFSTGLLAGAALLWGGVGWFQQAWQGLALDSLLMKIDAPWVGCALILLALLIGIAQAEYAVFEDEGDNLTTGWLLSQGEVLYRDVFTHHFPLPYVWTAGVIRLLGPSLPAVRISLLVLQLILLAVAMHVGHFYLQAGLFAIVWSLTAHFHLGHMVLYDNFAALFILPAFLIVFSWATGRTKPGRSGLVLFGLLAGAAVLSDPLMVYPAAILFAGIFLASRNQAGSPWLRLALRQCFTAGLASALLVGGFALYLLAAGALEDFTSQAIYFNTQVYDKYTDADPDRLTRIMGAAKTGLGITEPRWRERTRLKVRLHAGPNGLKNSADYESWIFTNFGYRLAVIVLAGGLILSGRLICGLWLYLLGATLLIRTLGGFHAGVFIAVSQASVILIMTGALKRVPSAWPKGSLSRDLHILQRALRYIWVGFALLACVMTIWLTVRSAQFLIENRVSLSNSRKILEGQENWQQVISSLACGELEVRFQKYPMEPSVHFAALLRPATRFTYLTPWVSDYAHQEILADLSTGQFVVISLYQDGILWDYPVREYLDWLIEFLNDNYVNVSEGLWISPALAQMCQE